MTRLQLALTSNEEMDGYLEFNTSQEVRQDILAYSNADRTVIATSLLQGLISQNYSNAEGNIQEALRQTDMLITALNKQS